MEERSGIRTHKVTLNNRHSGNFSGVKDVISFDPKEILLQTEMGTLLIRGEELHVSRLSLERGEVDIDGLVISMTYSDTEERGKKAENFLGKLFR